MVSPERADEAVRPDSDIDLVLLTGEPARYSGGTWVGELGFGEPSRTRSWGVLTEQRFVTATGLEVEIGIGDPGWAGISPIDPGTRRVVTDGARILYDPTGILDTLLRTCR